MKHILVTYCLNTTVLDVLTKKIIYLSISFPYLLLSMFSISGLIINRDDTGIWAHNRSNVPIFVNSPTLDVPNSRTFNVFKIPAGFSMQIFNFDLARTYQSLRDPACYDGPFDPYSVRLSFAKGWGQNYARQYIECCPCWLEILLIPPR